MNASAQGLFFKAGDITGGGGGGGFGFRGLGMRPPIPNKRNSFLIAYAGAGMSVNVISVSGDAFGTMLVPPEVGFGVGLGNFKANGQWKGAALNVGYKPSLSVPLGQEGAKPTFSPVGFELGLDFVKLDDLVKRYADRAHIRAYGFFLPPINDLPLFVLIGVGAVWY